MTQMLGEDRIFEQGPECQVPRSGAVTLVGLRGVVEHAYVPRSGVEVVYRRDKTQTEDVSCNYLDLKKLVKASAKLPRALPSSVTLDPYYTPKSESDKTLVFESRFESGNLAAATKSSDTEYNLILQNDTNSKGHTQWFYFRVSNTTSGLRVTFNILNFGKPDSLFNYGMKVLVLSTNDNQRAGLSWTRGCDNISYYPNNIRKNSGSKSYYTLTFNYTFAYSRDTVYFAYSYPYTYSDLMEDLARIESDSLRSQIAYRGLVCNTILGNRCEHLTVTGFPQDNPKPKRKVVISARVHPGETVGSWMMRGALEFLTSQEPEAKILRDNYVFKIVPMLNPDGVVNGNYRCGLAGVDLNRRWKTPSKNLHPTIYHTKRLIKEFAKDAHSLDLVCDLHGHSRKKNIFMYGCNVPDHPEVTRLFPYLLAKVSPYFSYKDCRFKMQKSKEATMRIALYKETRAPNIFTLEASFCGNDEGPNSGKHFTSVMLQEMGKQLCLTLLVYNNLSVPQNPELVLPGTSMTLSQLRREDVMHELLASTELLSSGLGHDEDSTDGSDSSPSEDNLDEQELAKFVPVTIKRQKTDKRSRPRTISIRSLPLPRPRPFKEDSKEVPRCVKCGEAELPGHQCPRAVVKPVVRTSSRLYTKQVGLNTYFNAAGKKVHDQATQTASSSFGVKPSSLTSETYAKLLPPPPSDKSSAQSFTEEGKREEVGRKSPSKLQNLGVVRTASGKARPALPYIPKQSGRLGTPSLRLRDKLSLNS